MLILEYHVSPQKGHYLSPLAEAISVDLKWRLMLTSGLVLGLGCPMYVITTYPHPVNTIRSGHIPQSEKLPHKIPPNVLNNNVES